MAVHCVFILVKTSYLKVYISFGGAVLSNSQQVQYLCGWGFMISWSHDTLASSRRFLRNSNRRWCILQEDINRIDFCGRAMVSFTFKDFTEALYKSVRSLAYQHQPQTQIQYHSMQYMLLNLAIMADKCLHWGDERLIPNEDYFLPFTFWFLQNKGSSWKYDWWTLSVTDTLVYFCGQM